MLVNLFLILTNAVTTAQTSPLIGGDPATTSTTSDTSSGISNILASLVSHPGSILIIIAAVLGVVFVNYKRSSNKPIAQREDEVQKSEEIHGAIINADLQKAATIDTQIQVDKDKETNIINDIATIIQAGNIQIQQDQQKTSSEEIKQGIQDKWKNI